MHIIYKGIQTESFNCTLGKMTKCSSNGPSSTLEVQSVGDFLWSLFGFS